MCKCHCICAFDFILMDCIGYDFIHQSTPNNTDKQFANTLYDLKYGIMSNLKPTKYS